MSVMTLHDAEGFVKLWRRKGAVMFWDGWTLCAFKPHRDAVFSPRGHFHRATSQWGYLDRYRPDSKSGKYFVKRPKQYL